MKKIRVAELEISMEYNSTEFFDKRLKQYEFYKSEKTPSRHKQKNESRQLDSCMYLKTTACEEVEKPEGPVIFKVCSSTMVQTGADEKCIYTVSPKTGIVTSATYFNSIYTQIVIKLLRESTDAMFTLAEREYIRTGMAFSDRLTYQGGLILHGSAISYMGHGIIFSAPSGTGKSTHAGLWQDCYGSLVTIINDDKPAIRFKDDTPYVYGTPWSGKTDINVNIRVPLKAVVFLKQSGVNRIERLSVEDSMYSLISETISHFYDSNLGVKALLSTEKLVKTVPIYLLHCNMSHEAVRTAYNEIIERGNAS